MAEAPRRLPSGFRTQRFSSAAGQAQEETHGSWKLSKNVDPFQDTTTCTLTMTSLQENAALTVRVNATGQLEVLILPERTLTKVGDKTALAVRFDKQEPTTETLVLSTDGKAAFVDEDVAGFADRIQQASTLAIQGFVYDGSVLTAVFDMKGNAEAFTAFERCRQ